MIVATTSVLPGSLDRWKSSASETTNYPGIVTGEANLGANVFRDLFAGIRDIVGGGSGAYERELARARDIALEMEYEESRCGANAVIGVDIDYETIAMEKGSMLIVTTGGTAVVADL